METSFYAHRRFRFYRWFVPHHLLCVHHRAGSITEYLESFKLQLGSYSHEVKVPFIRANRTSVRSFPFCGVNGNRTTWHVGFQSTALPTELPHQILLIVLEYPSRSNLNCLIVVLRGPGRNGDEFRFHSGLSTSVEWGKPLSIS